MPDPADVTSARATAYPSGRSHPPLWAILLLVLTTLVLLFAMGLTAVQYIETAVAAGGVLA